MKKYTFFWSGIYSQWYKASFTIQGTTYNCAEQYMMHQKAILFGDYHAAKLIMETKNPREQKAIGRTVKGFIASVWNARAKFIVKRGNHAKFTQNPELLEALLATAPTILVEASPRDSIWGIGIDEEKARKTPPEKWPGTNWLGEVLTELREELVQSHGL